MELSIRMRMNVDMIPRGCHVADIGCDHGYVSIYLVENNLCDRVIAMDVREGPLSAARKNIERAGLSDRIRCRLSDGIEKLERDEADTLLMAGMGGMLVCRILRQGREKLAGIKNLILQPQSDVEEVRRCLTELGYRIEDENCCCDSGKYYLVMRAVQGSLPRAFTEADYHYGWILPERKDPIYYSWLQREKEKREMILDNLGKQDTAHAGAAAEGLQHTIHLLEDTIASFGEMQKPGKVPLETRIGGVDCDNNSGK